MRFFGPNLPKKGSYFQSEIEFCILELVFLSNLTLNKQFCLFGPNLLVKDIHDQKVNIIFEFHIFKLVLIQNFKLNWQFWVFWPDLSRKGFSNLKQKQWTPHIFYIILLDIQICLVRNFSSNWQFWFFRPNLTKRVFPAKNRKIEHHHGIPHIWISLDKKFQLKLIIFSLWT